ncbi:hypothetical protein TWF718_001803 [Orbilia javanica]|uniref:Uncharacterized protein n=1 Tax=Orbilia javanica TaxID=47235 RepID=A0AAN8RHK6_9PEZI
MVLGSPIVSGVRVNIADSSAAAQPTVTPQPSIISTGPASLGATTSAESFNTDTTLFPKSVATKTVRSAASGSSLSPAQRTSAKALETTSLVNGRVVSPSFFYTKPMHVSCKPFLHTLRHMKRILNGEIEWGPWTGLPKSVWDEAVLYIRDTVENLEYDWQQQEARVYSFWKVCFSFKCTEDGVMLPHPRSELGDKWDPNLCAHMLGCECYATLGQPAIPAGDPIGLNPLHEFQDAINRIPESVRERSPGWEWLVDFGIAQHQGQTLGFTTGDNAVNIAPSGEPPYYLEFPEEGPPQSRYSDTFMKDLFDFEKWDMDQTIYETRQKDMRHFFGFWGGNWNNGNGGAGGAGGVLGRRDIKLPSLSGRVSGTDDDNTLQTTNGEPLRS